MNLNPIIDVRLGSKYASEKTETFKKKLRFPESLRLLQRVAFLIMYERVNQNYYLGWFLLT